MRKLCANTHKFATAVRIEKEKVKKPVYVTIVHTATGETNIYMYREIPN